MNITVKETVGRDGSRTLTLVQDAPDVVPWGEALESEAFKTQLAAVTEAHAETTDKAVAESDASPEPDTAGDGDEDGEE